MMVKFGEVTALTLIPNGDVLLAALMFSKAQVADCGRRPQTAKQLARSCLNAGVSEVQVEPKQRGVHSQIIVLAKAGCF